MGACAGGETVVRFWRNGINYTVDHVGGSRGFARWVSFPTLIVYVLTLAVGVAVAVTVGDMYRAGRLPSKPAVRAEAELVPLYRYGGPWDCAPPVAFAETVVMSCSMGRQRAVITFTSREVVVRIVEAGGPPSAPTLSPVPVSTARASAVSSSVPSWGGGP